MELAPHVLHENVTVFMFETSPTLVFTPWAVKLQEKRYDEVGAWEKIKYRWPEFREQVGSSCYIRFKRNGTDQLKCRPKKPRKTPVRNKL